jgi:AraC-like DNA-binding protein
VAEPVVPDGCAEIVLNLADPFTHVHGDTAERQPLAMVVGQMTGPLSLRPGRRVRVVGIRLLPWSGYRVLGVPMAELRDAFVPVELVLPGLRELHEALAGRSEGSWAPTTFAWLARRLGSEPPGRIARAAVRLLGRRQGRASVAEIAAALHVSARSVQRAMHLDVGMPPVTFARILRVQRAIRRIRELERPTLGRVAVEAGYYDHAHFCRDFREFTGLAPSELLAGRRPLTEAFLDGDPRVVEEPPERRA